VAASACGAGTLAESERSGHDDLADLSCSHVALDVAFASAAWGKSLELDVHDGSWTLLPLAEGYIPLPPSGDSN
jgi:hypothetical protein